MHPHSGWAQEIVHIGIFFVIAAYVALAVAAITHSHRIVSKIMTTFDENGNLVLGLLRSIQSRSCPARGFASDRLCQGLCRCSSGRLPCGVVLPRSGYYVGGARWHHVPWCACLQCRAAARECSSSRPYAPLPRARTSLRAGARACVTRTRTQKFLSEYRRVIAEKGAVENFCMNRYMQACTDRAPAARPLTHRLVGRVPNLSY
jgi:hypothetical protein